MEEKWGHPAYVKMEKEDFTRRLHSDLKKAREKKEKEKRKFIPKTGYKNYREELYSYILSNISQDKEVIQEGIKIVADNKIYLIKIVLKKELINVVEGSAKLDAFKESFYGFLKEIIFVKEGEYPVMTKEGLVLQKDEKSVVVKIIQKRS